VNDLDFRFRGALVFLVGAGAACTFPDITYNITGTGSGGGGGATSTTTGSSSGGASTSSMTTSNGGGAVGGGSTTTSDGGAGAGGSTSSSTSSAPGCDEDGDLHDSDSGNCGGDDCNDAVKAVHGGQTNFFDEPITPGGTDFDYNCNGMIEATIATACAKVNGSCPTEFVDVGALPAACGQSGVVKSCGPLLTGCVAGGATAQNATVKCH